MLLLSKKTVHSQVFFLGRPDETQYTVILKQMTINNRYVLSFDRDKTFLTSLGNFF